MKIKNLTTRQDRGQDFMLFRCRQNKDCMRRRFLKRFQKRIKRSLTKHVDLINDIYFIGSMLRRNAHLFDDASDIFDFVI